LFLQVGRIKVAVSLVAQFRVYDIKMTYVLSERKIIAFQNETSKSNIENILRIKINFVGGLQLLP
jgi:predicted transcriptional regulator